jgi:DNA-binding MarR family transcriptional regulator
MNLASYIEKGYAPMQEDGMGIGKWTFLTNHAHVLLCLAKDRSMRVRDISQAVGITERAVHGILSDLVEEGFVEAVRDGRGNIYTVHEEMSLRHPLEASGRIHDLIRLNGGVKEQ